MYRQPVDARAARPKWRKSGAIKTWPSKEAIRRRAHEIYLSRNGKAGSELQDWLQAEREIRSKT